MFVVGDDDNDINEYTLTTGFDVSSASFVDGNGDGTGFSVEVKLLLLVVLLLIMMEPRCL